MAFLVAEFVFGNESWRVLINVTVVESLRVLPCHSPVSTRRELISTVPMETEPAFFAAGSLLLGLPLCFAGYKYMRMSLVCTSFVCGGFVAYIVAQSIDRDHFAKWISFTIAGLLCAASHLALMDIGILSSGFMAASLLAVSLTTVARSGFDNDLDAVLYSSITILGVIGAVLVHVYDRLLIIACLSTLKRPETHMRRLHRLICLSLGTRVLC